MKRWLRRFSYGVIILVWLVLMAFPFFAFTLATRGELQIGRDGRSHLRFFMVQESDANGVGVEWTRPVARRASCLQTGIVYLMWEGEGENSSYCRCYDPETNALLSIDSLSCP